MRYSFTVAALFASVAVAHLHESSGQDEGPAAEEGGYYVESTAYSTAQVTVTACDSTVKDCPLRSHTPVPAIETSHPSGPVSHPALSTSTPTPEATSVEIPVESHPSVPVVYSVSVPLYPTAPSVPSPPFPIGTAPAGSACPVCSAPVTIYSTITSIPTEAPSVIPASSVPISGIQSVPVPSGIPVPSLPVSAFQSVPIPSGGTPAGTGASSGL